MALLGIPSGSVVEKLGGRTTMLVCDFARAPIMASIPLLYAADLLSFPLLLALVALLGVFMPPYAAAQRVVLPELVGRGRAADRRRRTARSRAGPRSRRSSAPRSPAC